MRLFSIMYERVMAWSRHPHAAWYLGGLSFAESSFFPIPPDVMLAPMSLGQPKMAWRFALLTTLASAVGGLLGYLIGTFAFELIEPLVGVGGRYHEAFLHGEAWFERWGVWAVFLAGFSPIPYKIFTITAGVMTMALLPFFIASVIGRGARFFLVAALMAWGGEPMERRLRQYVDTIGWVMVALIGFALLLH